MKVLGRFVRCLRGNLAERHLRHQIIHFPEPVDRFREKLLALGCGGTLHSNDGRSWFAMALCASNREAVLSSMADVRAGRACTCVRSFVHFPLHVQWPF